MRTVDAGSVLPNRLRVLKWQYFKSLFLVEQIQLNHREGVIYGFTDIDLLIVLVVIGQGITLARCIGIVQRGEALIVKRFCVDIWPIGLCGDASLLVIDQGICP